MYIDCIWPFTTFISRNKHKKTIRLRLYWLRLRVAEAEVQTSHFMSTILTSNTINTLAIRLVLTADNKYTCYSTGFMYKLSVKTIQGRYGRIPHWSKFFHFRAVFGKIIATPLCGVGVSTGN